MATLFWHLGPPLIKPKCRGEALSSPSPCQPQKPSRSAYTLSLLSPPPALLPMNQATNSTLVLADDADDGIREAESVRRQRWSAVMVMVDAASAESSSSVRNNGPFIERSRCCCCHHARPTTQPSAEYPKSVERRREGPAGPLLAFTVSSREEPKPG